MLTELDLGNFQKHHKRKFPLARVTVFSGATNAGKSAILRALGLVCLNRWAKCYVRHGREAVSVLLMADGRKLYRKKGKGVNLYSLDSKRFKAFGSSVPEEIAQFLNVGPENFQRQTDPHFWFSDTAGQVSKHLNKIVNLEKIDRALARISTKVSHATAAVKVTKERLKDAKSTVESLKWIKAFSADAQALIGAESRARQTALASSQLGDLVRSAIARQAKADRLSGATLGALNAIRAGARMKTARDNADRLRGLIAELDQAESLAAVQPPDFEPVKKARFAASLATSRRQELEELVEELALAEKDLCTAEAGLKKAEQTLAAKTPKKCPTCGRSLNGRSLPSPSVTYTCGTRHR